MNGEEAVEGELLTPEQGSGGMTVSQLVERSLYMMDKPFRFERRVYLRRIYDSNAQFVFMKAARAVEKTTWLANIAFAFCMRYAFFRTLFVSASRQQATDFSRDKVEPGFQAPWIQQRFYDRATCDNNVFRRSFTNGSRLDIRHVYGTPDRVRGKRADLLEADEVQDIQGRFMPIVEETLTQSAFALRRYSGTPKTVDNAVEQWFRQTTQEEWCVKCVSCGKWNDEGRLGPGLGIENIGLTGPMCRYCNRRLDVLYGRWVKHGDGDGGLNLGFRVPQLIIPYYQDPEVWRKQILGKLSRYHPGQFANEVLGFSYDDAEKPLSEREIQALCRGPFLDKDQQQFELRYPVFAGVDWGSGGLSKTVLVIGGFANRHVFQVFYGKIFSPVEHPTTESLVSEIARLCLKWNVSRVACDFGYGHVENEMLREFVGDDVVEQYESVGMQRQAVRRNDQSGRYQHNMVQTLGQLIVGVKRGRFVFPRWRAWQPFAEHMMNCRKEYNWHTGRMTFANSPENPDDALHALNLAWLSARIYTRDLLQRQPVSAAGRLAKVPEPDFLR